MNREDILARSRAENRGMDEYERSVLEKAGRLAMRAGLLACCITAVLEVWLTERVSAVSWTIYFCILSTSFWVKYRCLRRRHELAVAVLYTAIGVFFAVLFLLGVMGAV